MRTKIESFGLSNLAILVSNSNTFSTILKSIGMAPKGGNIDTLKKFLKLHSINFDHIPQGQMASTGRRNFIPPEIPSHLLFTENSKHCRSVARRRIIRDKLIKYECAICDLKPIWHGKELVLRLDHIDGVDNNHSLSNLRFVCPNCDSQLSTFGGKNIKIVRIIRNCKCGKKISRQSSSGLCPSCVIIVKNQSLKPPKDVLSELVWKMPSEKIGEQFGVSGTSVAKWCKQDGIAKPGPGYWSKQARKAGIEPTYSGPKSEVLPLNYFRKTNRSDGEI